MTRFPRGPLLAATILAAAWPVPAAPVAGEAVIARIDPQRSTCEFLLETTWHDVEGHARFREGSIRGSDLFTDGRVTIEVDATSMETGNARRDRKMHDEFMETGTWPVVRFTSGSPPVVRARDDAEVAFDSSGTLEVHGRTREVVLALTARRVEEGWRVTGEQVVSLNAFGIPSPSILINRVSDAVTVRWDILLVPVVPGAPAD